MKKKVESVEVGEVEVGGLNAHRNRGKGLKGKPFHNSPGLMNIVSQDLNPYPNKRKVTNPDWGDIQNTQMSDEKAYKKFRDEE